MTIKPKNILAFALLWLSGTTLAFDLPRTAPEAQGVPSAKVSALIDSLTSVLQAELHSLTLVRHGNVIAEVGVAPFSYDNQHELFSVSKTFTGAAVGLAIADNLLRLDDRLGAIIPEALPDSVPAEMADITVLDLLTMTSGIPVDWMMRGRKDKWTPELLSHGMASAPGKNFAYDSMSSYLLSAIVQKVTGRTVLDYVTERIFTPLGITDFAWDLSPEGVTTGGWGLWMKPESLARFGQMLLDGGRWNGRQILPEQWVKLMTTKKIDVPGTSDYCYQMWTCDHPNTSRADGAWGQYIIMMPDEDMVAVITQCQQGVSEKMQSYVWNVLSPALSDKPLPVGKDYRKLQKRISSVAHPFPAGKAGGHVLLPLLGKTLYLPENPMGWRELTLVKSGRDIKLIAQTDKGITDTIVCGNKNWVKSVYTSNPPDERADTHNRFSGHKNKWFADAAYGCTDAYPYGTFEAKIFFTNWYSSLDLKITPGANDCDVTFHLNYSKPVTVKGVWKKP